jgi:hypothetical protein
MHSAQSPCSLILPYHIQTISLVRLNPPGSSAKPITSTILAPFIEMQATPSLVFMHTGKLNNTQAKYANHNQPTIPGQRTANRSICSITTLQLHLNSYNSISSTYNHTIRILKRTTNNTPRPQRPPILQLDQKPQRLSRPIQLPTLLMRSSEQTPSLTIIPSLPAFRQTLQ